MTSKFQLAQDQASHLLSLRTRREPAWRDLSRWICPWRGVIESERVDRYDRDDLTRFTHAAASAVTRGASGMTSGMTPRNVSWFTPAFTQEGLEEEAGAREWLEALDLRVKDCLGDGGFYQAIQNFNLDLLWAGCALLYTETSSEHPLTFECVQIGTFAVGLTSNGALESVLRQIKMPVSEAARVFGKEKLTRGAQADLERAPYKPLRLSHLVRPAASRGRYAFDSLWWEEGGADFLRESGYYELPYFFTVWNEGATFYGTGPGDDCLADARQMDFLERHKLNGLGKLADPPVGATYSLKEELDLSPGAVNWLKDTERVIPLLDMSAFAQATRWLQEEIINVGKRLETGLQASIFTSMPLDQRPKDMSATEFLERKREALQQLGPVISAYEPNVLTPLLYRVARTLDRAGLSPIPPQSLAGQQIMLKIDFISPMANALRQNGVETTRALYTGVGELAQLFQNQEVLDKIDCDQIVDELARGLGAPAHIVRADADVAKLREARAEQMQQQQQQALQQELLMQQVKNSGSGQG